MELNFIGTTAPFPGKYNATHGIVAKINGKYIIYDAPENTQQVLKQIDIQINQISYVFISHMHLDHCAGLLSLLQTFALTCKYQTLKVFGPPGIKKFIQFNFEATHVQLPDDIVVDEYDLDCVQIENNSQKEQELLQKMKLQKPKKFQLTNDQTKQIQINENIETQCTQVDQPIIKKQSIQTIQLDSNIIIDIFSLNHVITAFGYFIQVNTQQNASNVHNQQTEEAKDQKPHNLNVMIAFDTTITKDVKFIQQNFTNIHYLVTECTFLDNLEQKAIEFGHNCPKFIKLVCQTLNIRHIILSHFSARYLDAQQPPERKLLDFSNQTDLCCDQEVDWGNISTIIAKPHCYIVLDPQ